MFRGIEQEQFDIDDPDDLIRGIGVNGYAAMSLFLYALDCLFISQIVRQHESVYARRHTILRGSIAQLDDFLNHLSFAVVQRAVLFTHLKQCAQFFIAQTRSAGEMCWRETINDIIAYRLQPPPDAIEEGHCDLQG